MLRIGAIVLALASVVVAAGAARAQDCAKIVRYESLRAGEVYFRAGPGADYPVDWVMRKKALPVAVIGEYENWRRVCDVEGTVGWVHRTMLAATPTVVVVAPVATLRREPKVQAPAVARAEATLVGELDRCDDAWCRVTIQGFSGWVERKALWGALQQTILP